MIKYLEAYNVNPKGLKDGDCVIRAIAYASYQTWEKVYEDLSKIGLKTKRVCNSKKTYEEYLEQLGFIKMAQPRRSDNTKYEIRDIDFVTNTLKFDVIISCANHLTCVDNNQLIDIWDCRHKCISNYWIRLRRNDTRPENHAKKKKTRVIL